jgi:hypothetical protein
VRLHRAPGHLQLLGNFIIVTALQEQFYDLLLPWPQLFFLHQVTSYPNDLTSGA